jgi:hypothetical protein
MSIIIQIERDLSWRETELALFREMLSNKHNTPTKKRLLFRAAWAMLYAHYEGFSKFCWTAYLEEIQKRCSNHKGLRKELLPLALDSPIKWLRSAPVKEAASFLEIGYSERLALRPKFPEVDTKSNLWPNVFEEILSTTDTECNSLSTHREKIRAIVSWRNDIAHGKNVVIEDLKRYLEYEGAVLCLMYDLALDVCDRLDKHYPTISSNESTVAVS